jgi:predicted nucleic acid-binding protein
MKGDKTFLDTNVLLYAFDRESVKKHPIARDIVEDLWRSGTGILSTQVLQEFFVNVTKKIAVPVPLRTARGIVLDFLKWKVVVNDGGALVSAIDIQAEYGYSFWDALILQAALEGGVTFLLSEDLKDGQRIQGVTIRNPFREARP